MGIQWGQVDSMVLNVGFEGIYSCLMRDFMWIFWALMEFNMGFF